MTAATTGSPAEARLSALALAGFAADHDTTSAALLVGKLRAADLRATVLQLADLLVVQVQVAQLWGRLFPDWPPTEWQQHAADELGDRLANMRALALARAAIGAP